MNPHLVEFERSVGLASQLPDSQEPEFVFCGRSNVGKSSLINRLFGRKNLARVSSTPGKTATINFYRCPPARFVDLPGYGYAKVARDEKRRWDELIGGYFEQNRNIALMFLLLDIRHPPSAEDRVMLDYLIDSETPFAVLLTKADKLTAQQRQRRLDELISEIPYGPEVTMVPFSSVTGDGFDEVWQIIDSFFEDGE